MLRTYQSGLNRYLSFCYMFGVSGPFPVSEALLCYFMTSLAREGVAPSTVQTYLAESITPRSHPGPCDLSSLPRLRLVQNGIRRESALTGQPSVRQRLPITPVLLRQMRPPALQNLATARLWAATTVCLFCAGEITVLTPSAFNAAVQGDVAIADMGGALQAVQDGSIQTGDGGVSQGHRKRPLPVRVYVARRGAVQRDLVCTDTGPPVTKARFVELVRAALTRAGVPIVGYSGQLPYWSCNDGGTGRDPRLDPREVIKPCIPGLHPHPQGEAGP